MERAEAVAAAMEVEHHAVRIGSRRREPVDRDTIGEDARDRDICRDRTLAPSGREDRSALLERRCGLLGASPTALG
jgi:hypothetical protein